MTRLFRLAVLSIAPFLIVACTNTNDKVSLPEDSSTQQSAIQLTPSTTSSCKAPLQVLVEWNVAKVNPTVKFATLYITSADGITEKLFAEGGKSGRAETGKWVYAEKTKFILRDKSRKTVLAESFVKGPGC